MLRENGEEEGGCRRDKAKESKGVVILKRRIKQGPSNLLPVRKKHIIMI